jgi:hypothetical protein
VFLVRAIKSGGVAPFIRNLGTRWTGVVSFTTLINLPAEKKNMVLAKCGSAVSTLWGIKYNFLRSPSHPGNYPILVSE